MIKRNKSVAAATGGIMKKSNILLTQRVMASIAKQDPSSINRYISSEEIMHEDTGNKRNLKYGFGATRKILSKFISQRNKIEKKVHCFYNFKGGTGKTSLCFQLSSHLSLCGFKVLVIDADPQGNISTSFGFDIGSKYLTLYDIIIKKIPPQNAIKKIFDGLDCIPSNITCSRFDMDMIMMSRREEQIKIALSDLKKSYDFIFFDCGPYISFVLRNILVFSDIVNIPCETQPYSLSALRVLFDDIFNFFQTMQISFPIFNVIPNKYEDRYGTTAEAMTILKKNYENYLIPDFAVRKAEDFNIAAREMLPICCVAKRNSIALEDIIEFMWYMIHISSVKNKEL